MTFCSGCSEQWIAHSFQHITIPRMISGAKPAVLLRHLMRAQLGPELNPALVPMETKHSWRYCPAQGMQVYIGIKDGSVVVWQWVWLCDGISGAGCWFCGVLIWSRLPMVVRSLYVSVNQDQISSWKHIGDWLQVLVSVLEQLTSLGSFLSRSVSSAKSIDLIL